MMTTMNDAEREAVARAICEACEESPYHQGDAQGNEYRWQDYLPVADAAISTWQRTQAAGVPDVYAMARVLSDRSADACNIDRTDNWAMYGHEYIEDVQAMLAAAPTQPAAHGNDMPKPAQHAERQQAVHWRAVLDPAEVPMQLNPHEHIAGFTDRRRAEDWIAARLCMDGWYYTLEPLYASQPPAQDVSKQIEALRAENERLRDKYDRDVYGLNNEGDPIGGDPAGGYANDNARLRTELESARGLLRESREAYTEAIHWEDQQPDMKKIDTFLTATQAPEVPDHIVESNKMVDQGERQDPVAWIVPDFGFLFPTEDAAQRYLRNINDLRKPTALYTLPAAPEGGEV